MIKLTKVGFALTFGLILSLGLLTSGAFAQSVQVSTATRTHAIIPQANVQPLNLRQHNALPRGMGHNRMSMRSRVGFIRPARYNRVYIRPVGYNHVYIRPVRYNRVYTRPARFNHVYIRPNRFNRVYMERRGA